MKKKINCVICGGSGYHGAYFKSSGEVRSPCGGCNGTGFQWVEESSQAASSGTASSGKSKGCLIFLAPILIIAAGAAHSFLA